MVLNLGRKAIYASMLVFLISCGDQSLFMSLRNDTTDIQVTSVTDGQVIAPGRSVPLMVTAQDPSKSTDVEIEITLSSPSGASVWHKRTAASLNVESSITIPADLAPGLYKLDLVLYSAGEVVQRKSSSFFVARDGWTISGIKSFPPVITVAARVMLQAEIEVPAGANPYLRWSWKGKPIARGTLSAGFGQIFWDAPADAGVYTIVLELFPSAPATGTDFPFTSSLALSTDIFVSGDAAAALSDLGPAASYLSLLRLQASLSDSGTGASVAGRSEAVLVGSPAIVTRENGFGYRLDGSNGIRIPWLALPVNAGTLQPFTVSIGVTFDDPVAAGSIVTATTADRKTVLRIELDPQRGTPVARLSTSAGAEISFPWSGPALSAKQRYQVSLSVVPRASAATAQWFLDGTQVSVQDFPVVLLGPSPDGSLTIGGDNGFKGIVDEFGIYTKNAAGRASSDPDLYARAQKRIFESGLVLADGFDSPSLSAGFAVDGAGSIVNGSVRLPAGSGLSLPAITVGGAALSLTSELTAESSTAATLQFHWEGSATQALETTLSANATGLQLRIAADGSAVIMSSGSGERTLALARPETEGARLVVRLAAPASADSPLVVSDLLVVKDKQ